MSSYRDPRVWAEGMAPAEMCYGVTSTFPGAEAYGMTSQARRAADSGERSGRPRAKEPERVGPLPADSSGLAKGVGDPPYARVRVELMPNGETDLILEECEKPGKMPRDSIRSMQHKAR